MTIRRKRLLAFVIATAAGVVVAAAAAFLVADYVGVVRRAPGDKDRLVRLEKLSNQDVLQIAALDAERDRQLKVSIDRDHRNRGYGRLLLLASVLFLVGAKWFVSMRRRRPPDLITVLTVRGVPLPVEPAREQPASRLPVLKAQSVDLGPLDAIISEHGRSKESVIPILQAVQSRYGYLPRAALERVCEHTAITPAQIEGVASFYTRFRRTPVGKHLVKVCHGTACHVAGAERLSDELRRHLGIPAGADTDADLQHTIEPVACMGCCTLAPVAQVDGVTHGHLTAEGLIEAVRESKTATASGGAAPAAKTAPVIANRPVVRIGLGSCCVAGGSGRVFETMRRELARAGADAIVKRVGCVGMCHNTPLVEMVIPGREPILYTSVQPQQVRQIVRRHFRNNRLRFPLLGATSEPPGSSRRIFSKPGAPTHPTELRDPPIAAFLGPQRHIATEHGGQLDPVCLDEYLEKEGFAALKRAVELSPQQLIEQIRAAGLRGRGGAGFPTGEKWARVRGASGEPKYVICNGDEGDPGAFMDRMLMESFPYRIIEGLAVAARAVGASEGYFYIRAEYPLAVERIRNAIEHCEQRGLLGDNILNSGFSLRLHIMQGAGAFVCGEETALIASIQGDRGTPRLRPPYPAQRGLWDSPTLVNNVETLACVPWILRNGPAAFASLGTPASKGTKVFALAGKVLRGGLIEVPMGVTIRQIIEEIGGGTKPDPLTNSPRQFKAVQIGGPSGGCVPAGLADTPIDFEALADVGAIMGSGGLVVLDETDCMVDIARYFLSFTQDQSCGKCTYCRIGTKRMLELLDRFCEGRGTRGDLQRLEDLARQVMAGSLCGLGRTAPNPVLTTLRYFRDEYEAHIDGRCPAGKCKALIAYRVTDECIGCTLCAQHCPADAIEYRPYERHEIDAAKRTRCDICRTRCPEHAIRIESPMASPVGLPVSPSARRSACPA
jgi:NADH-quinone oxidoreductase subunit F